MNQKLPIHITVYIKDIKTLGQKYSILRCLLHVKGLVICFYLGWSGSILQIRTNMIKVGSESWLLYFWVWDCISEGSHYKFFKGRRWIVAHPWNTDTFCDIPVLKVLICTYTFLNCKLPLKFQQIYFMFYKVSLESLGGNTLHMEKFYYLTCSQIEHEKWGTVCPKIVGILKGSIFLHFYCQTIILERSISYVFSHKLLLFDSRLLRFHKKEPIETK